jgi:acyl-CoA reductase-like NAD-dependent aldehyde dehydrogenase
MGGRSQSGRRHRPRRRDPPDAYYEPTVLTDVPSECRVIRDEVFGPVVSILPFIEVRDAVFAANNTEFGLQAGVFTQSIDLAMAVAEKLHVGAVMINETSDVRIDSMPFGGFKKSGVGREGVRHEVREMTEPKNTVINLCESKARWQALGGRPGADSMSTHAITAHRISQ